LLLRLSELDQEGCPEGHWQKLAWLQVPDRKQLMRIFSWSFSIEDVVPTVGSGLGARSCQRESTKDWTQARSTRV